MSTISILGAIGSLFYTQFFVTPDYPTQDCTGKTFIVTGANTGLGKETVRHFVRLGASKVILTSRNASKGQAAKDDIEASTKRTGVVEVWPLNLQDFDSVRSFAERVKSLPRIDAVIENAGISTSKFVSVNGIESTILVNVVSTFLLALLLIPHLQQVAKVHHITPTLTIVSSEVHAFTPFSERKNNPIYPALNDEEKAVMSQRYLVSKLLEVLACREIAKEHPVDQLKITLNFANPGWCYSELSREMGDSKMLQIAMRLMARTEEVGARNFVVAGLSGPETHGKYISDTKVTRCAPLVEGKGGPELQKRWWNELSGVLEEIEPGITKVLDN